MTLYADPPPPNDKRTAAAPVQLNTPIDDETWGAQSEPSGENLSCTVGGSAIPYDKTIWYRFDVPAGGQLTLEASGFDTAVALYRAGAGAPLGCNTKPSGGTASLPMHVGRGSYLAQVGGQGEDIRADRGNVTTRVGFVKDPPPQKPPVVVVPTATPTPKPPLKVVAGYPEIHARASRRTRIRELLFYKLKAKDTVRISCRGGGCTRRVFTKRFKKKPRTINLVRALRGKRLLKAGAILEIRITAPGKIGKVFRYKMRRFRLPRELTRTCLQPGAKKRSSCPT
jgi:hypothetical protein